MERELGVDRLDLPHAYRKDSDRFGQWCQCGRDLVDGLHDELPVQERAAAHAGPMLVTEKGS